MKDTFTQDIICDKLFQMIEKPKNTVMCKAINLWNDRYRINVYAEHERDDLVYRKIDYSCFAIINKEGIKIIDQTPSYDTKV